jgi:uncharacterized protein GlcG (DUF336 family)
MRLTLQDAREILETMLKYESKMKTGKPSAFAVVDRAGVPIYIVRMDMASPLTARVCVNKAFTATYTARDTKESFDKLFTGDSKRDVAWFGEPRYSPIPGGVLLKDEEGGIVGAIGTSGRTMDEDEELARVGLKCWQKIIKRKGSNDNE